MADTQAKETVTTTEYKAAPYLQRLAAASIDATFLVASCILLFVLLFGDAFPSLGTALGIPTKKETLRNYQIDSGLVVSDKDGNLSDVTSSTYTDYEKVIYNYYFVYNASSSTLCPKPRNYTIANYNQVIYELPTSPIYTNNSSYYDFASDAEGNADASKLGVLKKSLYDEDGNLTETAQSNLLSYFKKKYSATEDLLRNEDYYKSVQSSFSSSIMIIESLSLYLPFLVFYFVIPMFSPFSRTLGKKFMALAVIDKDGVAMPKWKNTLRLLPFIVSTIFAIVLDDLLYSISLLLLVFLISFGTASFTKKRLALHDYIAHSVVVKNEDAVLPEKKVPAQTKEVPHA